MSTYTLDKIDKLDALDKFLRLLRDIYRKQKTLELVEAEGHMLTEQDARSLIHDFESERLRGKFLDNYSDWMAASDEVVWATAVGGKKEGIKVAKQELKNAETKWQQELAYERNPFTIERANFLTMIRKLIGI